MWHHPHPPPWPSWPRPTPNKTITLVSVGDVEPDPTAPRAWAGNGEFQEAWRRCYCLRSPGGCLSCSPLPKGPALLTLHLVQKPREPMFANIPLNGGTGIVHGRASRSVTSVPGMKANGLVRREPSRSGETPPTQPEHPRRRLQSGAWWWEGVRQGGLCQDTLYLLLPVCHPDPSRGSRAKSRSKCRVCVWGCYGHFPA